MDTTFKVHNFFARIANLGDIKKAIHKEYESVTKVSEYEDDSRNNYEILVAIAHQYLSDSMVEDITQGIEKAATYAEQARLNNLDINPLLLAQYENRLYESYAQQESSLQWGDHFDNDLEAGCG